MLANRSKSEARRTIASTGAGKQSRSATTSIVQQVTYASTDSDGAHARGSTIRYASPSRLFMNPLGTCISSAVSGVSFGSADAAREPPTDTSGAQPVIRNATITAVTV